ncbi:PAC2 family protein [Candidatus Woesearchaeota archaeon]|nr:PAC2 family protein [Candidatus Woesearchaeota archaeon]
MGEDWKIKAVDKVPKLKNPVMIEGLPGIGNVGKISVDFIIDNLKAKKIYDIFSYNLPHSVFIKENSLVELPKLEIYYKKGKKQDIILLSGDVQPVGEQGCYAFCNQILEIANNLKCREIVTIGGIGLEKPPQDEPKVYCAASCENVIKDFEKKTKVNRKSYGVVGPVVGVTGVLVGLSDKIPAIALLAETYAHPLYIGIRGERAILKVLEDKYNLGINIEHLDDEIKDVEAEVIKKTKEMQNLTKKKSGKALNYIG